MIKQLKKFQFFWNLAYLTAGFYPLNRFSNLPKEIAIELTNHCNLRCPVCPTHFFMKRERGFMDFELFKSIIDEFKGFKKKPRINFIFAGEPLLHPQAYQFIDYAHQNGHFTFLSTNTTALSNELSKKIIESGLDSIHLCIDGATKQSHEAYRFGSNFEIVKSNIENFLKIRKDLNRDRPSVSIQTLLTSYSENEIDRLLDWARLIGADSIQFKSLSMGSFTTEEMRQKYRYLLPKKQDFLRRKSEIKKTVCTVPLNSAVVFWNGSLGLCCVDFDSMVKFPKVENCGFIKTFISLEVAKLRKKGFLKKHGLCDKCSLSDADFMGWNVKLKK